MTKTLFYFAPTGNHTQLSKNDTFDINRWAISDTTDLASSAVNIDETGNFAEVVFEGNLTIGHKAAIIQSVTNNLNLAFAGHEKPAT